MVTIIIEMKALPEKHLELKQTLEALITWSLNKRLRR
jgi:hypothetical protein